MRKQFCFFLWFLLFAFLSGHVSGMDADTSRKFHKEKKVERIKIKRDSTKLAEADTIKLNVDSIGFHKKHRLVAALLAFPLGVFGLHRMYLHTSWRVPLVYIVTLGGALGVLPFIDFVLILLNKDIHINYTSNPHIFMWQKR